MNRPPANRPPHTARSPRPSTLGPALAAVAGAIGLLLSGVAQAAPAGGIAFEGPAVSTPTELLAADFGRRGLRMPAALLAERYKLACDGGWATACDAPAWHRGPAADLELAAPILEKACDMGDGPACVAFGWVLESRARARGDGELYKAAARRYKAECDDRKNQYGCYEYGAILYNSLGVSADPRLGVRRWEQACAAGEKAACTALARAWRTGATNIKPDPAKATEYAKKACDAGDPYGCLELDGIAGVPAAEQLGRRLALCRAGGVSTCWELAAAILGGEPEPSAGVARGLLDLGCELGSGPSCANAASMAARDGDAARAGELYRQACALEDPSGCAGVVELVLAGKTTGSLKEDMRAFEVACERGGNASACSSLGLALLDGQSFPRDPARARALLSRSCVDPSSPAASCLVLGGLYETGSGGDKDRSLAAQVYRWACSQGLSEACERRGDLLHGGVGVKLDDGEAVAEYQRACDGGRETACFKGGFILDEGAIVTREPARARDLYGIACDKGVGEACLRLGLLHEEGAAGGANPKAAREAYEKAVKLQNVEAHRRLARLLWNGLGGRKEKGRAKSLCETGCRNDDPIACSGPASQRPGR